MIPPSIVLIFYGLITETSIKALFTASFLPGFMLATFFIIYIIITTRMDPSKAPLPEADPDDPEGAEKGLMFLGFLGRFGMWITGALLVRVMFFTVTGQNVVTEGVDPIPLGMASDILPIVIAFVICGVAAFVIAGRERTAKGWEMGKGLIAPTVVIGVVLGSIYGGITGITEAAGMGVIAVFVIGLIRREMTFEIVWDFGHADAQIHRNDYLGDHRCCGLGGSVYAGRWPNLCCELDRGNRIANHGCYLDHDVHLFDHGHVYGLGGYRTFGDACFLANRAKAPCRRTGFFRRA